MIAYPVPLRRSQWVNQLR